MQFAAFSLIFAAIAVMAGVSGTDGAGSMLRHLQAVEVKMLDPDMTKVVAPILHRQKVIEKVWFSSSNIPLGKVCQHYEADTGAVEPRRYYTEM
jgi:hypothetical protein